MARRVFYSFHYDGDVNRAHVVRNSWVCKPDREDAGFFDSSAFETAKRTGTEQLKRFLNRELQGSSVTCVLAGNRTWIRPWIRYELVRSFAEGKGLFGISIHSIRDMRSKLTDIAGANPFSCIGLEIKDQVVKFKEWNNRDAWIWYDHIPSMRLIDVRYPLNGRTNILFDSLFPIYDWSVNDGYSNLGGWVERAANHAGR